tara:strand:+ start:177 stop:569 length:393 start_codon:yes stop_codon:yes gene_type:complete
VINKKLILISALLFSFNGWAEEYPIELTCELEGVVVYFYLEDDLDESWFEVNGYAKSNSGFKAINFFHRERLLGKKNKMNKLVVEENRIEIAMGNRNQPVNMIINRLTGKSVGAYGECFKGFKEYNEKKF